MNDQLCKQSSTATGVQHRNSDTALKRTILWCLISACSLATSSGCDLAGPSSPFAAYQQCHSKLQDATGESGAFACFVDPAKAKLVNQWTDQTEWLSRYKDFREQTRGKLHLYQESVGNDGKTAELHLWGEPRRGGIPTLEVTMAKGFLGWKIADERYTRVGVTTKPNAPQPELSFDYPGATEHAAELLILGGGATKEGSCLLLISHAFQEASIQIPADCTKLMQPGAYSFADIAYAPWVGENRGKLLARFPNGGVLQPMNAVEGEMIITAATPGYSSGHFSLQITDSDRAQTLSGSFKNVPASADL